MPRRNVGVCRGHRAEAGEDSKDTSVKTKFRRLKPLETQDVDVKGRETTRGGEGDALRSLLDFEFFVTHQTILDERDIYCLLQGEGR
jgi:hypothetical protein